MKIVALIVSIFLLPLTDAVTLLWRIFMPTIENSTPLCQLYTPEEYAERMFFPEELELADMSSIETVTLDLHLEFPFSLPEDSLFLIEFSPPRGENGGNVYFGPLPASRIVQVNVPVLPEYPESYLWGFFLIVPSKFAICSWAGEESMNLMDENFSRSWRVKLYPHYWNKKRGGNRSTVFEPL